MISILGGELYSALGDEVQRLGYLSEGKYNITDKTMVLNDVELKYPYYCIDENSRNSALSIPLRYLEELVQKAIDKLSLSEGALSRCGLFLGSSSYDLSLRIYLDKNFDNSQEDKIACERIGNGYYAEHLIQYFGLNDFSLTYNTACTSSANAILDAASMLEGEIIDYALVIGMEMFIPITFEGFASMQLLSNEAIAPFDKNRNGIVLGEALSALFLSRSEIAPSNWIFRAGASNCETHSVTGANADGIGIGNVIRSALQKSDVTAEDIVAVKAHGTASALNDLAEINGMKHIFDKAPPFFSFKPYIGHTLGSCGSSELLLFLECIDAGFIPESPNFREQDEILDWTPIRKKMSCTNGVFLLNYFGFGGNNTSLVIEKRI